MKDNDRADISILDKSLSYVGVVQSGEKRTLKFSEKIRKLLSQRYVRKL